MTILSPVADEVVDSNAVAVVVDVGLESVAEYSFEPVELAVELVVVLADSTVDLLAVAEL